MHQRNAADMATLESVSAQQRQQRSSITPHQLKNNNDVNRNLSLPRTRDSRVLSSSRSSCNAVPYIALLMMASLLQTSVAAGYFEVEWRRRRRLMCSLAIGFFSAH